MLSGFRPGNYQFPLLPSPFTLHLQHSLSLSLSANCVMIDIRNIMSVKFVLQICLPHLSLSVIKSFQKNFLPLFWPVFAPRSITVHICQTYGTSILGFNPKIIQGSIFLLSTSSHISAQKPQHLPCVLLTQWLGLCHFSLVSLNKKIFFSLLFLLSFGWVLR